MDDRAPLAPVPNGGGGVLGGRAGALEAPPRSIRSIRSHGMTAVCPVPSSIVAWSWGIASMSVPRIIPPPRRWTTSFPIGAARGTVTTVAALGGAVGAVEDGAG